MPHYDPEKLVARRQLLGLTQIDVAEKAKVSEKTVWRVEHGAKVRLKSLARVAAVLGSDVGALGSDLVAVPATPAAAGTTPIAAEPLAAVCAPTIAPYIAERGAEPAPSGEASPTPPAPPTQIAVPIADPTVDPAKPLEIKEMKLAAFTTRDVVFGGISLVGALCAAATLKLTLNEQQEEAKKSEQELRDLAFKFLFGESKTQYYVPSVNNPYNPIQGITPPTRDALTGIFSRLGLSKQQLREVNDPCTPTLDGSLLLLGGPVANIFTRQIMGTGRGSPLFSRAQGKPIELPLTFANVVSERIGVGHRPEYQIAVRGKPLSGLERSDCDFLLLTSMPNVFSPHYGVFGHRIMVIAGWHGAGTRSIELVLKDAKLLAELSRKGGAYQGWQAIVKVSKVDGAVGKPIQIGEHNLFEIRGVDFDRIHDTVRGKCYWVDPDERLMQA